MGSREAVQDAMIAGTDLAIGSRVYDAAEEQK